MSYFNKRRSLLGLGDSGPGGATCSAYDATGNCVSVDASDTGINNPDDANMGLPTSSSSTSQDTTVLPDGSTVGGQATGTPIASTNLWKTVSGICYATTTDFLGTLKELQRQSNRVASVKGWPLIGIDGSVGPATLGLMGKIAGLGAYGQLANPSIMTCDAVCSNVYAFIATTQRFADGLGASSSVASPTPSAPPKIYDTKVGGLVEQGAAASLLDAFGNLSSTEKLLAAGGALGLLYFLRKGSKKKGKK